MNNNIKTALIVFLLITVGLASILYYNSYNKEKLQKEEILSLQQKKDDLDNQNKKLESDLDILENTNQSNLNQITIMSEEVAKLQQNNSQLETEVNNYKKQSSSTCTKNNSCKLRTPGSGFRCDKNKVYSEIENYWCECTINCDVTIK